MYVRLGRLSKQTVSCRSGVTMLFRSDRARGIRESPGIRPRLVPQSTLYQSECAARSSPLIIFTSTRLGHSLVEARLIDQVKRF
jgi:hypothetical protein